MGIMKSRVLLLPLLLLIVLLSCETVSAAYQLEYRIDVNKDCSVTWFIEHRFLKGEDEAILRQLSDPTYFSDTFVKNIESLVNATKEKTGRTDMTVENFVMTTNVLGSYSIVEYQFCWKEFAKTDDERIAIGDVFEVEGLFLYGEGTVKVVYPLDYVVESVSPRPHNESNQTLTWYGIEDFKAGEPKIVLREEKSATSGFMDVLSKNVILISGLLALLGVGSVSLYYFKFRKRETGPKIFEVPKPLGIEDDEEKVINLLRAAGGSMYQSSIADQCGFSRSKASKLLTTMENSGKIKREERGREKVITLIEEVKEFREAKKKREKYS